MASIISQWLIILFALWLIVVSLVMIASPQRALQGLSKMASTNLINYTEITLRLIAGAALATYAEFSKFPETFRIVGLFIIFSSLMLYLVPRRWHAAYAVWWSRNLPPVFIRFAAPFSLVAGGMLIYVVV